MRASERADCRRVSSVGAAVQVKKGTRMSSSRIDHVTNRDCTCMFQNRCCMTLNLLAPLRKCLRLCSSGGFRFSPPRSGLASVSDTVLKPYLCCSDIALAAPRPRPHASFLAREMATPTTQPTATWAHRARIQDSQQLADSTPPPAPQPQPPQSSAAASTSKASQSDNWRATTSTQKQSLTATTNEDGWTTLEKKPARQPSSHKQQHRGDSHDSATTRHSHKSRPSNQQQHSLKVPPMPSKASATATAGTSTSWADIESSAPLPSPTFAAPSLPPTETTSNGDDAGTSHTTTMTSSQEPEAVTATPARPATGSTTPSAPAVVPTPAKKLAPIPKVNVWSVRKEQLASAAASGSLANSASGSQPVPATTSTTPNATAPSASFPVVSQANTGAAGRTSGGTAKAAGRAKKGSSAGTGSNVSPTSSSSRSKAALAADAETTAASSTAPAQPQAVKRSGNAGPPSWSDVQKAVPVPVLGGDIESWPSPNEEPAAASRDKGSQKGKGARVSSEAAAASTEPSSKKKGESSRSLQRGSS